MKKIDDLIEKILKFFEKNSIQPFTGKVEGQIKGYLKDGMPEGTWQEFSQKGEIISESNYIGEINGKFFNYFYNKVKEKAICLMVA